VGYDTPQEMSDLSGASYPGHIWQNFMKKLHEGKEPLDFMPYVSYNDTNHVAEPEEEEPEEEEPEEEPVDIPGEVTNEEPEEQQPVDIPGQVTEQPEEPTEPDVPDEPDTPTDDETEEPDESEEGDVVIEW
jgi:membrane peptidoglycan carboxypeptidase